MSDLSKELQFLETAILAMEPMNALTRKRVLNYLWSRYMPRPEEVAAELKAKRERGEL